MGQPAEKERRATYADLEAVPPNKVAELVRGTLHVFPRPAPRHARASSGLGIKLGGPFDLGDGGPGGRGRRRRVADGDRLGDGVSA